jgi:glycosyltransferase involved in cell wall biosynthesis
MRILTVCTSTNVFGAEVVTLKMLDGFKRAGHEQLAITTIWTDGEFNRRLALLGIREVRLPFGAFSKRIAFRPLWWTLNTVVRLPWLWIGWSRIIRRFQPEIIIFTSSRLVLPVYPLLERGRGFLIEHGYLDATLTRRKLYRLFASKLIGFLAVSDFMARQLEVLGAPKSQIFVVKNGVFPISEFPPLSNRRFGADQIVKVGIIGRISQRKGHETLLEAVRILRLQDVRVQVLVFGAGDESYVSEISRKLSKHNLIDSWRWMGYAGSSDEIYPKFDICVMPSSSPESFGLAAVEAAAFGLPVIAANCGGLPEIVDHEASGFLVEPDNAVELADRLRGLMESPERVRNMGLRGREKILREFTQERMVSEFERIFDRTGRKSETNSGLPDANGNNRELKPVPRN